MGKGKKRKGPEVKQLGPYRILQMIGKGGMGAVFTGVREGSEKKYAIKLLLPTVADKDAVARFKREIEAGKKLDHPGIVKIHEVGRDGDKYYFAMDFVDGKPLDKLIFGEGVPAEEGARLIRDAAEALQHAHENGVVHRDIKPSNLIRSKDGDVFITDFGIASEETSATLTADGQILGTPYYMAPEQAMGLRKEVGPGSDVYSLGITFYELLTRTTPFRGEQIHHIIRKILSEDPIPPSEVAGGVPRDLEMVVMKAIRKEREKRYASAKEFAEDLDRFLDGKPVLARPLSRIEKLSRAMKHQKGLFAMGAVACLLFVALCVFLVAHSAAAKSRALKEARERREKVESLVKEGAAQYKQKEYEKA
ncbi:MAG: serine/threonine protein kinase, partial [Planctomycetota bacterium]